MEKTFLLTFSDLSLHTFMKWVVVALNFFIDFFMLGSKYSFILNLLCFLIILLVVGQKIEHKW